MHQHILQLASVFDQLDEGVIYVDTDGHSVFANRAARGMFTDSKFEEGPKEQWADQFGLVDPKTGERFRSQDLPLARALRGETIRDAELEVRMPQRAVRFLLVDAYPLTDDDGAPAGAVAMFRDITARKQQEILLRASEWQKATILDHVPFATWLKDRQGRYVAVNAAFTQIVSLARDQVLGHTDAELWGEEQASTFARGDSEVMDSGRTLREVQFLEVPPFQMVAEIVKRPLYDHDGLLQGTIGLARDVTAERTAEQALLQANEELERRVNDRTQELERVQASLVKQERLAALGQLAGGVAHQMRNPLAAITSASYVLRRHLSEGTPPDAKLALEIILEEARHTNDIITGLLDYTRTRAAIVRVVAVTTLVERAMAKARTRLTVNLDLTIDPALRVMVDAEQVTSALCNLIDNAFDAMPSGGTLSIVADQVYIAPIPVTPRLHTLDPITPAPRTPETPRTSEVPAAGPAPYVRIVLQDTGAGIVPDRRGDLFTPLFTTKPLGLGLGLVTARTLIERQGGALDYVEPGAGERGATFVVHLPVPNEPG